MTRFIKTTNCPTSWELLDLALHSPRRRRDKEVLAHTVTCEFCAAELDLYFEFPPITDDECETPPIPEPLRELASSVLTSRAVLAARLDELLGF